MVVLNHDMKEMNVNDGARQTHDLREEDLGVPGMRKSNIPLTQIDEGDMYRLGKEQELNVGKGSNHSCRPTLMKKNQRNFRFISIMGFAVVLMGTWEGQLRYVFHAEMSTHKPTSAAVSVILV